MSNKEFNFTSDVMWVGLSQVVVLLVVFLTLPVLSKNYGTANYGLWAQILVTVNLLVPILNFQLLTATVRYITNENKEGTFAQSFANMFWIIVLAVLVAILFGYIFRTNISGMLFKSTTYSFYIILTFIWAGTSTIFAYLLSYWRANGEIKKLSIITIAVYIIKFIPLIILAILHYPLWFIVLTQIGVEFGTILILFVSISWKIGFKLPNTFNLRKYLSFSVPQIPSAALLWIMDSSDRYFITGFLGLSQTGIYSASYGIGSLTYLFFFPISFVIFPIVTSLWERQDIAGVKKYFEYSTKIFLFLGIPASAGLYVLSKPLLQIITTPEFSVGGGILTFLIAVSILFLGIYQINLYIIYLIEKTKFLPFIVGLSAIINILINIILIPKIGIIGAAISTILSYLILSMIVLVIAKRRVNYKFDFIFLAKTIISSIIMVLLIELIPIHNLIILLFVIILGSIIYMGLSLILRTLSKEEMTYLKKLIPNIKLR